MPLLERLKGDPRVTEHLGGPDSPDKLRERQARYARLEGGDRMFKIVDVAATARAIGLARRERQAPLHARRRNDG